MRRLFPRKRSAKKHYNAYYVHLFSEVRNLISIEIKVRNKIKFLGKIQFRKEGMIMIAMTSYEFISCAVLF